MPYTSEIGLVNALNIQEEVKGNVWLLEMATGFPYCHRKCKYVHTVISKHKV